LILDWATSEKLLAIERMCECDGFSWTISL
jgi:hypothetical protein